MPTVWVICNNGSYESLKRNLVEHLGPEARPPRFVAMDLDAPPLRFDRLAEAHGVRGRRVDRPEDVGPALAEALRLNAPALIDVSLATEFSSPAPPSD